jgi:hypothetical protein
MVVICTKPESPEAEQPAKRPKRPVTAAMLARNRAAAKSSTGPRTADGKAASSVNAVTHGATSQTVMFLPGEDPEEFYQQVDRWAKQLGAFSEPEYAQVERAVYQLWKARRAGNANVAAMTRVIENIAAAFAKRQYEKLLALLEQLPIDPRAIINQLMVMSVGLRWQLEILDRLAAALEQQGCFGSGTPINFLYLNGFVPTHLFSNPRLMSLQMACLAAACGTTPPTATEAAALLADSQPSYMDAAEFARQLEPHVAKLPTAAQARAFLTTIVAAMRQKLTRDLEVVTADEQQKIDLEITEARSDVTAEGSLRERYETAANRQHDAALRTLRSLQDARRKYGEGDLTDLEAVLPRENQEPPQESAPGPWEPVPAGDASPAEEAPGQNEPYVTQVAVQVKACNEGEAANPGAGPVPGDAGPAAVGTQATTGHRATAFQPLRE